MYFIFTYFFNFWNIFPPHDLSTLKLAFFNKKTVERNSTLGPHRQQKFSTLKISFMNFHSSNVTIPYHAHTSKAYYSICLPAIIQNQAQILVRHKIVLVSRAEFSCNRKWWVKVSQQRILVFHGLYLIPLCLGLAISLFPRILP